MCKPISGLFFENGDVVCEPEYTHSHEVLVRLARVNDGELALHHGNFVRWEFTLPDDISQIEDLAKWNLKIDEQAVPAWLDRSKLRDLCERRVVQMFVRDQRGTVLGGCWIVRPGGGIRELVRGTIISAEGDGLTRANLTGANLARANLARANLTGANLTGANLTGANLGGANLTCARHWTGSNYTAVTPEWLREKGAIL